MRGRRMTIVNRYLPALVSSAILAATLILASSVSAQPLNGVQPVGSTTLRVFFFRIYDSTLYSPDGEYQGIEPGLTLVIDYNRNIPARELIARTQEEWRAQSLFDTENEQWLVELQTLWPDINKGDSLTVEATEDLGSRFYFNGEVIGEINNSRFTEEFLAIWLSPDSSYPEQRRELVGLDR